MKLIAETAWHHDGDFNFFKDLVSTIIKETKADYIKFHITLDVDEYMHIDHPAYIWAKERVFSETQWKEILEMTIVSNKKLMLLFNDKKAIDFGMKYKPELVEIHSVCLNDVELLQQLSLAVSPETKIVLGVGGSDLYEIENAISVLDKRNIVLMHGFQNYPTKYTDINFGKILKIMQLNPEYEQGYADHTAWDNENNILITLLGANLGMHYIEKHVTTIYGQERVDWPAAISIEMFNELSEKLDIVKKAFGNSLLKLNEGEKSYSTFGVNKKAAVLKKDMKKEEVLTKNSFSFKRTEQSSDLSQLDALDNIGQKIIKDLSSGHCLKKSDFVL
jgi:N,N'-diacetyllegionaminate synthase